MTAISALQAIAPRSVKLVSIERESPRKNVHGSHSQTAHVWAQNRYLSGRSSDERMFFEAGVLYSYGRHFALGMTLETSEGRVTLLNDSNYSISTSKHKGYARYAATGDILMVPDLTTIVSTIDAIRCGRRDSWQAKQLPDFIKKHILDMPAETTAFLAGLIGKGRCVCAWWRAADKARKAATAKAKAADIEARKEAAIIMADSSPAAWARELNDVQARGTWGRYPSYPGSSYGQYRKATPGEELKAFATEMHRLNVTAKAHLSNRRQATLKARLAQVRAMAKEALKWESKSEELAKFRRYKATFRDYLAIAAKALTPSYDKRAAETLANLAAYFAALPHASEALKSKLADIIRAANAHRETLAAIEAAERMEKERAGREKWLAGEGDTYARYSDEMGRALIRVKGDTLETSHGANVPLADAIKAFRFVKLCRERGQGWKRNGATLPVGHFQIDAIDATGNFIAGCHKIGWNEISRLAAQLGLSDTPAADTTLHA